MKSEDMAPDAEVKGRQISRWLQLAILCPFLAVGSGFLVIHVIASNSNTSGLGGWTGSMCGINLGILIAIFIFIFGFVSLFIGIKRSHITGSVKYFTLKHSGRVFLENTV